MNNLRELLDQTTSDRIWFWIGPRIGPKKSFLKSCEESGVDVTDFFPGNAVSLHRDGTLRHVSLMVWMAGFIAEQFLEIPKIDFEDYIAGKPNYVLKKCNLTPVAFPENQQD